MKRYARLAALGAIGVAIGSLAIYVLIVWIARPTPTGGIDQTQAIVTWISAAVPIAAIAAVHLAYARMLRSYARSVGRP